MSIVERLFVLTGQPGPEPRTPVAKLLARSPRDRLVRAVAWFVHERQRDRLRPPLLVEGIRAIGRGWSDLYEVDGALRGAAEVTTVLPERGGDAIAIRGARWGNGWTKPAIPYVARARPEIELATTWLLQRAGCVLHDDCVLTPELAYICLFDRHPELAPH